MTFVILPSCVVDFSCVEACPADCIHPTPDEPGYRTTDQLFIDPNRCIDCGVCDDVCPVDAVRAAAGVPGEWRHHVDHNAAHYRDLVRPGP